MSEKVEKILELAIRAAGDTTDRVAWRKRLITAIGDIAGMWNEHSLEWKELELLTKDKTEGGCQVFWATYHGYRIEASSTRLMVSLQGTREGDEPQEMRTERTDEILGAAMQDRLDGIEVGTRCRCWRFQEQISREKSVNILKHIEPEMRRDSAAQDRSAPAASTARPHSAIPVAEHAPATPAGATAPESNVSSSPGPAGGPHVDYHAALEALTQREKVLLAMEAKKVGITDVYTPADENVATILSMMEDLRAKR